MSNKTMEDRRATVYLQYLQLGPKNGQRDDSKRDAIVTKKVTAESENPIEIRCKPNAIQISDKPIQIRTKIKEKKSEKVELKVFAPTEDDLMSSDGESDDDDGKKKNHGPYSLAEDEAILLYIVESGKMSWLKGNTFWEEAEQSKICGHRSYQSLKERFRRYIVTDLDKYGAIDDEQKELIRNHFFGHAESNSGLSTTKTSNNKRSYSYEEDLKILKYIVSTRQTELVKGKEMWEKFEKKNIIDRTWQSSKERFLKRIVPNLDKYGVNRKIAALILNSVGMADETKEKIIKACKKPKKQISLV